MYTCANNNNNYDGYNAKGRQPTLNRLYANL